MDDVTTNVVRSDRQSINVRRGNRILEITSVSASGTIYIHVYDDNI